jgi:predicted phosphate transport protein (TIGR00153 family)
MIRLIPREEKYFELMNQLATKVREGGETLFALFQDYRKHAELAEHIKTLELDSDEIVAQITNKLNSTFITPIDREDIYLLVTELDDVIDLINDIARRLEMYGVTTLRPDAKEIAAVLNRATRELKDAFSLLENSKGVSDHCRRIRQLEKEADHLYRDAVRRLFAESKDPFEVIKWMSLYEEMEQSIDRCKDVAEALEAVVVKNK